MVEDVPVAIGVGVEIRVVIGGGAEVDEGGSRRRRF